MTFDLDPHDLDFEPHTDTRAQTLLKILPVPLKREFKKGGYPPLQNEECAVKNGHMILVF